MELYVNIANLDIIKAVAEYYPIDGFTANPKILAGTGRPVAEMMKEYRGYVEENNYKTGNFIPKN